MTDERVPYLMAHQDAEIRLRPILNGGKAAAAAARRLNVERRLRVDEGPSGFASQAESIAAIVWHDANSNRSTIHGVWIGPMGVRTVNVHLGYRTITLLNSFMSN